MRNLLKKQYFKTAACNKNTLQFFAWQGKLEGNMLKNTQSIAVYSSNYRTGLAKPCILGSRDWTNDESVEDFLGVIFLPGMFRTTCMYFELLPKRGGYSGFAVQKVKQCLHRAPPPSLPKTHFTDAGTPASTSTTAADAGVEASLRW